MKNNKLISSILSIIMLTTASLVSTTISAAPSSSKTIDASTVNSISTDELERYSEIFASAKKLMDNPKTWDKIPAKVTLCIFSPEGAHGKGFDFAMNAMKQLPKYTQIAKNMGIDVKIKMTSPLDMHIDMASNVVKRRASTDVKFRIYTNEKIASEDFKAKQCDGVAMSNLRAKEFNKFIGSLDSIGAIPSYQHLTEAIRLLSKPAAAKYMINDDYETIAIIPMGAAYIMVNDRRINSLAKAAGKKIAVLDYDKSQAKMVQQIGAQPISVDLTTIGGKFNNGQVDIMAGPALIFKPFELHKGMTSADGTVKGAIIRFPVVQVTGVMMMRRGKFPEGVGQLIREFAATQTPLAYQFINETEHAVDPKFWMEVPAADKPGYTKLMRESRIQMTKEGYYDKRMMSFLKKIRCHAEPAHYECSMTDE